MRSIFIFKSKNKHPVVSIRYSAHYCCKTKVNAPLVSGDNNQGHNNLIVTDSDLIIHKTSNSKTNCFLKTNYVNFDSIKFLGNTRFIDDYDANSTANIYAVADSGYFGGDYFGEGNFVYSDVTMIGQIGFRVNDTKLDGAGTEDDPYKDWTFEDLDLLNPSYVRDQDFTGYYKQIRDLTYSGTSRTRPSNFISSGAKPFSGTYDGSGFTIYNHTFSSSFNSYAILGFINTLGEGGLVKDINLVATDTCYFAPNLSTAAQSVGTIVGTCYGTVENCTSNMNIVFYAAASEESVAGGIIGTLMSGGSYSDCSYTGTITYPDGTTTSTDAVGVDNNIVE